MRVRVHHNIDRLQDDLKGISRRTTKDIIDVVRTGARVGNDLAKTNARRTSGKHGKHHHRAYTHELVFASAGFAVGEYGPDASRPQGGMNFEEGPGLQRRPHKPLAKSLDVIGPAFRGEVRKMVGRYFW